MLAAPGFPSPHACSQPQAYGLQLILGLGGGGRVRRLLGGCCLGGAGRLLVLLDEIDDVVGRPATFVGGDLPAGSHEVHGRVALHFELAGHVVLGCILETKMVMVKGCLRDLDSVTGIQ